MGNIILLTGFQPFLDYSINPTEAIVKELDGRKIGEYEVRGAILPVSFRESGDLLLHHFQTVQPTAVFMLGLAAGRGKITPERVAININSGPEDRDGIAPVDEPIRQGGPAAYFSTLPVRRLIQRLNEEGFPAEMSNSAGTYVCNHVMYRMLDYLHEKGSEQVAAGFVHLPASKELAAQHHSLPSMDLKDLTRAVTLMIEEL
ncbi:pyroglutamyl-peptidase I [Halalkalibacterium halodurans]|uniref:pyroglutamyl-peptidase I n=1 Tax=Halalkalibacterium halodurans TaxID=86665 RepID=UPI002E21355A|nr:pyroglutamyl-peptidase I [Halalkalibacterium halodurans]MED4124257.1 pyroglutamyl-peptidase I [Halalkalibacterium halodurans]